MTVTHELGHVLAGLLGQGKLLDLELRPWRLPHSQFVGDRFPLITVWAGPVLGSLVPLAMACLVQRKAVWFIAWFCLLANGLYLFLGLFSDGSELDTRKMIRAGTPTTVVAFIAAAAAAFGYWKFRQIVIEMLQPDPSLKLDSASGTRQHWIIAGVAWVVANAVLSLT